MKRDRIFLKTLILLLCFLGLSCSSSPFNLGNGSQPLYSLDQLEGLWVSSYAEYQYPLRIDGKNYLRFALNPTDDTQLWFDFAQTKSLDFSDLWKKRFSFMNEIYSVGGKNESLPVGDENGSQMGRKIYIRNERIYSRIEYLIPENILAINMGWFILRKDSLAIIENGKFHFASSIFQDLKASGNIYYHLEEEKIEN
ncbi:MAG: hypothetical protein K5873_07760 [Treponema sp.]|nr:hypothetical protein [Treponema sp.]